MTDADRLAAALADRYRIERPIGSGGMATVYLAHDLKHDREVALKVLKPELGALLGAQRFLGEIRITARLDHPHILTLIDSGEAGGFLYYVLPLVRGESLRARLAREHQLGLDEAIGIARQVAGALDYAHRQGVVHRDIKPENILLHEGEAMIADFGIALALQEAGGPRLTETGISLGTPQYMSPEQATGDQPVDGRADIYSLGAVLYEMLAGEPPVTGPTVQAMIAKLLSEPPPRLGAVRTVPPRVEATVTRALAKVPGDRYATAAQLAQALQAAGSGPARRPGLRLALGALTAALAIIAVIYAVGARRGAGGAGAADPRSSAVLPFTSLSADPNDEYFSDGMSEELINALTRVAGLRVVPRTSAFSFKGRNVKSPEIGAELQVENLLEGSVRRLGSRVRVTSQLVRARSDSVLWSDEYERDVKDVWAVQDEIARAIVTALEVQLSGGGRAALVTRSTVSPEAYELYLRGRYAFGKRTGEGLRAGADYFRQAIHLDSTYAAAYSGLADALTVLSLFGYVTPADGLLRGKEVAQQALALDSSLAEARASLGIATLWYDRDLPGAERELKQALAIDPRYSTAHLFLAWDYAAAGRGDDAVRESEQARQFDPLSVIANTRVVTMLYLNRRYDPAIAQAERALSLDSGNAIAHAELARSFVQLHRCPEALAQLRYIPEDLPNFEGAVLGYTLATCGRRADAERVLQRLLDRGQRQFVFGSKIAVVYAALGRRDEAFLWMQRAAAAHEWPMLVLNVEPMFDALRGDPRFAALQAGLR